MQAERTQQKWPSATWYARATRLEPLEAPASTHPKARADIHRLRLGYHCAHDIFGGNAPDCEHCEAPTEAPLLHYLLECQATASIRNANQVYPYANDREAPAAAANLVGATSLPRLTELVTKAPPPR